MLARLRREFIAMTMVLVGLVLAGVLGISLVSSALTLNALTTRTLKRAIEGGTAEAQIGDTTGEQGADSMLAITVEVLPDGTVISRDNSYLQISSETLAGVVQEALASSASHGESDAHPTITWMRAKTLWGWRVAMIDTYARDTAIRSQATNSLAIFVISMGALFVVSYLLSGWMLRPVRRAWEQQRRFVSDASHELKTPLAVILANTQILQTEEDLSDGARHWVDSTSVEAKHMKGLVDDLLELARADEQEATGSGAPSSSTRIDVTSIVSGCALEFDAVAFERGCSIECELMEGVSVVADPEKLKRVVRTLLDNATKYADPDSVVRVSLTREGRRCAILVNNRGETISRDALEHVFDRFYRTDDARERQKSGGFGLGLAIAKSIVESMGGRISATSSDEGGTTFKVLL